VTKTQGFHGGFLGGPMEILTTFGVESIGGKFRGGG